MSRVRFAPSPTGSLHVGNALSAVANRGLGDWMLLRIDDTDSARNVPGGEGEIIRDLEWLGLQWEEGPVRQSEREELGVPQHDVHYDLPRIRRLSIEAIEAMSDEELAAATGAPADVTPALRGARDLNEAREYAQSILEAPAPVKVDAPETLERFRE